MNKVFLFPKLKKNQTNDSSFNRSLSKEISKISWVFIKMLLGNKLRHLYSVMHHYLIEMSHKEMEQALKTEKKNLKEHFHEIIKSFKMRANIFDACGSHK